MSELAYLYAVAPGGSRPPEDLRGVADAPVRVLEHDGLTAVWSPVPAADFDEEPLRAHLEDIGWLERTARAHQEVVDAVSTGGTILPLRMAVVYRDEDGVRRMLTDDHDRLTDSLHRLEGLIEWGVKVYVEERVAETGIGAEPSGERFAEHPEGRPSGRDYLRQRLRRNERKEQEWELTSRACRLLHAKLSQVAEADRLLRPQDGELAAAGGRNVLNASYLVAREHEHDFLTCARESSLPGVRVEVNGPWAPYSFAAPEAAR